MSLNTINWRGEALEFAKANDQNRESSVAIIEKAMKHGATLAVIETTNLVSSANDDLKKKRDASAPHREIKIPIEL